MNDKGIYKRRGSPNWMMCSSDENGRLRRESTGTKDKSLAKEILAKRHVQVAEGRYLEIKKDPKTLFFDLCTKYEEIVLPNSRAKGMDSNLKIWKKHFGNVSVREITRQKVERFLATHCNGLQSSTRNRHLAYLSSLFNRGIEWGLVGTNPCKGIDKLRETGARNCFLTVEEIALLLEASDEKLHPIVMTALHTGMRRGELFDLQWSSVDLRNYVITVEDSKSGKKRYLPVDDSLAETLKPLSSRFKKAMCSLHRQPARSGQISRSVSRRRTKQPISTTCAFTISGTRLLLTWSWPAST